MKILRHTATLFSYDGPQVFEARDPIGGHYLALAVDSRNAEDRYLVVGVPPERLRQFRAGTLDLREMIVEAGKDDWYLTTAPDGLDRPLEIERQATPIAESGLLPDAGFVLHVQPAEAVALGATRKRYQLRLTGLREGKGQIKAVRLYRVLVALLKTAERATHLLATGAGSRKGPNPSWLDDSIDFTITGLQPGSTVLDIAAPRLGETASEVFAQRQFWPDQAETESPSLDDTALDLASLAIHEAQAEDSPGDRFDGSVLDAILGFGKAAKTSALRYELVPQDAAHDGFVLDARSYARIEARSKAIPSPKAFIVSGRLDKIEHDAGRFRLLVNPRSALLGRLDPNALTVESLRPLWGKQTTVGGMVHFKANGQPRLIEARRIGSRMEGDAIFEEMPAAEIPGAPVFTREQERHAKSFDLMKLWGTWPGDEPIEELLAQLD